MTFKIKYYEVTDGLLPIKFNKMDNTEKAKELINKHLYLHGGDGLGITDGDVYRAVLDAVCEALIIPVVVECKHDFEPYYNWCSELAGYRCSQCGEEKD